MPEANLNSSAQAIFAAFLFMGVRPINPCTKKGHFYEGGARFPVYTVQGHFGWVLWVAHFLE
jgi:hypothetical protein